MTKAVRDMIDKTIGEDYPWYPVLGNHDLYWLQHGLVEDPALERWLPRMRSGNPCSTAITEQHRQAIRR